MTPDEARRRGTLSVDEAAALAGVGRDAMYEAVHAGTVPRLPFPERTIRIPAGSLLAMLGYATRDGHTRSRDDEDAASGPRGPRPGTVVPLGSTALSTQPHDHGVSAAVPDPAGER